MLLLLLLPNNPVVRFVVDLLDDVDTTDDEELCFFFEVHDDDDMSCFLFFFLSDTLVREDVDDIDPVLSSFFFIELPNRGIVFTLTLSFNIFYHKHNIHKKDGNAMKTM